MPAARPASRRSRWPPNRQRIDMATVPVSSAMSTDRPPHSRFGFFRAVPLALLVEGLLLGGAFALISHKAPAPPPPVTLLTLAAPPAPAPKQPQAAPPKPAA